MRVTAHWRPPIGDQRFDVVIVGGGINGVAIARECARNGLRTLILEKHDFASGTTSRSTRIIHGGLRYLEHGEFSLVRESLRERERLLCERPHLVRPMQFLLALPQTSNPFSKRSALAVRAALQLYRWLTPGRCRRVNPRSLRRVIDGAGGLAIFDYDDAQCEFPERLVAEWLSEAIHARAVARNHAVVLTVRHGSTGLSIRLRDQLTGLEEWVECETVINAAGPWVDQIISASLRVRRPLIDGVRGSHILLDPFPSAPAHAIYTTADDGRPFFIIPWNGMLMVGTTEVKDSGDPANAAASSSEIDYLLRGFNRLFPRHRKTAADIRGTMSGIRPLPATDSSDLNAVSRRSFIYDHAGDGMPGLYSIIGGKLTTAASLARQVVARLGVKIAGEAVPFVAVGPASGFENTLTRWSQIAAAQLDISPAIARATAEWHGRCAFSILRRIHADRNLATPIVDGTHHPLAEAVHATQRECAVTLADILLRRVPIALTMDWSEERSAQAARRIGKAMHWREAEVQAQLQLFEEERAKLLGSRGRVRGLAPAEHAA